MRRLTYALFIVVSLAVLPACKPQDGGVIVVTATPGITPTQETATWTPQPNATGTPEPSVSLPINRNAHLGAFESTLMPDFDHSNGIDERQWDIPAGFNIVWNFPNPTSPRVFPYHYCDGLTRCQFEIEDIDGRFLFRVPQFEFDSGQCYGLKIVGSTNITLRAAGASMQNVAVMARLEGDTSGPSQLVDLGRRPMPQFGLFDEFFVFWSDLGRPVASVEVGYIIDYPGFGGQIVTDEVSIREAPPGYCLGVDPWG